MNETCHCGHVMDEHESNKAGAAAKCSIEGCDCIYFDANEEASSEESD